ncbi:MAG: OpgC domain-containing protein, partial [Rhizobiales bacterium]|nr:OpgC domain-containing protein [Hyphomicrobiales bacterium]
VANAWRITLPSFPGQGGWYFNPFTWQILFVIGFVGGILLRRGVRFPVSRPLYGLAVLYLVASAILVFAHLWDYFPSLPEWVWLSGFNKSWVGIFRLLHVLAIAYVVIYSPLPAFLQAWLDESNAIVRLGRHTLPVFWVGTILSVAGHIVRESVFGLPNDPTFTAFGAMLDTVLIGTGLCILFGLAWYLDWTRTQPKGRPILDAGERAASPSRVVPAE